MSVTISLLHASYNRPEKAVKTAMLWLDRAVMRGKVEYILAVNKDDTATKSAFIMAGLGDKVVSGPFKGSAPAWNAAAQESTGSILVQVSDDFVPPPGWDALLYAEMEIASPWDWDKQPIVMTVSDGHRKDGLLCMAICTRAYYNLDGYFLHPSFISVFSDDHFTYRALKREREGTARIVRAEHLVFEHQHPYNEPEKYQLDATYAHQNRPEAYAVGERLFNELNPGWRESGLATWRK